MYWDEARTQRLRSRYDRLNRLQIKRAALAYSCWLQDRRDPCRQPRPSRIPFPSTIAKLVDQDLARADQVQPDMAASADELRPALSCEDAHDWLLVDPGTP